MSLLTALRLSAALVGSATAAQVLAPTQDINLPASESATEPLKWLGANGPWFAGEYLGETRNSVSNPHCQVPMSMILTLRFRRIVM